MGVVERQGGSGSARSYVVVEYIKPNSQASHRVEIQLGQLVAAVNTTSTARMSTDDVQALLTAARPLRLLLKQPVAVSEREGVGQLDEPVTAASSSALRVLLCCGRRRRPAPAAPAAVVGPAVGGVGHDDEQRSRPSSAELAALQVWRRPNQPAPSSRKL